MRKTQIAAAAAVVAIVSGAPAFAAKTATSLASDERVKQVPYDANQVYEVVGTYGYQTGIEFGRDETIKVVSLGDSIAWQTVPYQNRLFIKPVEPNAETNMTVITDKRTYYFKLSSAKHRSSMSFLIRFVYPGPGSILGGGVSRSGGISGVDPARLNLDYSSSGDKRTIALTRVFDDGQFTYFGFAPNSEAPTIYSVGTDGTESIVNTRREGAYLVVERTASAFTLRNGTAYLCVQSGARRTSSGG